MPNFSAGGIATPADAALMMQLGAEAVFVGSGIFKSADPAARANAIVQATTHFEDPDALAKVSERPRRRHARHRDLKAQGVGAPADPGLVADRLAREPGTVAGSCLARRSRRRAERIQEEGLTLDSRMDPVHTLPPDLPVPADDGACDHLPGSRAPSIRLTSTGSRVVDLAEVAHRAAVFFFYPRTGEAGKAAGPEWDAIPGARGCTPQSCGFRDLHGEFETLGVAVFGVSTQSPTTRASSSSAITCRSRC